MNQIGIFLLGLVFLLGGAELLVRGASRLAARFAVSPVVIGLTVVAFGTSLPELLVVILANVRGEDAGSLAMGNIVGSNIANLGFILGIAALLTAVPVERHVVRREYPILLIATAVFLLLARNGLIERVEGVLLTLGSLGFTVASYRWARRRPRDTAEALDVIETIDAEIGKPSTQLWFDGLLVGIGLAGLVVGARWLIGSAQAIAMAFGVSQLVIGLTLVAVGTSLPELATTVVAVIRRESDIALGNIVGSNLYNLLFIAGIGAVVKPLPVPAHLFTLDLPLMLGLTALVYLLALRRPHTITRLMGGLLLCIYTVYVGWLFFVNSTSG